MLPLIRQGQRWRLANRETPEELDALLSPLRQNLAAGKIQAPFHVEQFLGTAPDYLIPHDVKVYAFYGHPTLVFVCKMLDHFGGNDAQRHKYFNIHGESLTISDSIYQIDSSIPCPENLDEALHVATEISLATRLPHVRVDLYDVNGTIYFGEITPRSGGQLHRPLVPAWDRYLGECFEAAEARVDADIARGFINPSGPVIRTGQTPINERLLTPPR